MDQLYERSSIKKAYFTLAIAVVLCSAVIIIYNLVVKFFVSKTQNPDLVAGVSQGAPVFSLLVAIGDIFGLGGSSLISRLFGEKRDHEARLASGYCFYVSIIVGILMTIIMVAFQTPILHLLGATTATWQYAREYYLVIAFGAPFIVFGLTPTNILRTEGLAVQSMTASMVGTIFNIILNPIFIFPCGLGAAGSALATVVSNVIGDALMIYYLNTKSQKLTTSIHEVKLSPALQKEIYSIGIPASITNIMVMFSMALTNRYLIGYGSTSVAAMGIATKINTIIFMVMVGFAFGAQPLIGYTYGAKNQKRFNEAVRFDILVVVVFGVVATLLMMLAAPLIIRLFMQDQTVISEGTTMIRWLASSTTLGGCILVFTTMFQSMGKAVPAFWLSVSRQGLIFLVCIIVLHHLFGYWGIVSAQAASDVLTLLLAVLMWQKNRPHFKKQ